MSHLGDHIGELTVWPKHKVPRTGTRIELATDVVARTATAKEVRAGRRLYGLAGGDLAYAYDMAAMEQELQPHLSAQLKRVRPAPGGA